MVQVHNYLVNNSRERTCKVSSGKTLIMHRLRADSRSDPVSSIMILFTTTAQTMSRKCTMMSSIKDSMPQTRPQSRIASSISWMTLQVATRTSMSGAETVVCVYSTLKETIITRSTILTKMTSTPSTNI